MTPVPSAHSPLLAACIRNPDRPERDRRDAAMRLARHEAVTDPAVLVGLVWPAEDTPPPGDLVDVCLDALALVGYERAVAALPVAA